MTIDRSFESNYAIFKQRVRRYPPSKLVPLIAAISAAYPEMEEWLKSPGRQYSGWNLAEIARASLLYGNEYREATPTEDDLLQCCNLCDSIPDPDLYEGSQEADFLHFFLRFGHKQLSSQLSIYSELSRSVAMFEDTSVDRPLERFKEGWDQHLLGATVAQFTEAALLLMLTSRLDKGRIRWEQLRSESMSPIRDRIDLSLAESIAEDHFITDVAQFREIQGGPKHRGDERLHHYRFNPLQDRPIIRGLNEHLLVPSNLLLGMKGNPLSIYHTGVRRFGDAFARDTGAIFEAYVGRQLRLSGCDLYPEVTYTDSAKSEKKSVDWIAVFDNVTVLVEAKSTRPTEPVRVGSRTAIQEMEKRLGKAARQIETTAELIKNQHPQFQHIPRDKRILGLIVTMEGFHLANARMYRSRLAQTSTPYRFCSASELEKIAPISSVSLGDSLVRYFDDEEAQDHDVDAYFSQYPYASNSILESAWQRISLNAE